MAAPRRAFGASPAGGQGATWLCPCGLRRADERQAACMPAGAASAPATPAPPRLLGWAAGWAKRTRAPARLLSAGVVAAVLGLSALPAYAQPSVALAGQMGQRKALLVIDGRTVTLGVGETREGVKLLALEPGQARVEVGGRASVLQVGGAPVRVGGDASPGASGREIVLTMGPGGHFLASGKINGRAVRFMVDTGATMVSMSRDEAARLGVDYEKGRRGMVQTANGSTPAWRVTLSSVSVGDVSLANVEALVTPAPMPMILLGNSFLSRFQMRRDNDVMRLELR